MLVAARLQSVPHVASSAAEVSGLRTYALGNAFFCGTARQCWSHPGALQGLSRENPLWGASRIHGELLVLGFEVAQSTVSKRKPPSQSWNVIRRARVVLTAPVGNLPGESGI